MTDPILLQRLAQRLAETSEATPKGEGFWPTLAQVAAEEAARSVVVEQRGLPTQPFLAIRRTHEGFALVARENSLLAVQTAATTALEARGTGELWLVQIRTVLGTG